MVLESILNPVKIQEHSYKTIIVGALYVCIAIMLSLWVFEAQSSMVMVFLTVLAATPLIFSLMTKEEEKEKQIRGEINILKNHAKLLMVLLFLFIGMTLAFTAWYTSLPAQDAQKLFSVQTQTIIQINTPSGGAITNTERFDAFGRIFVNNIKVMTFCILFAFIYGIGALFVLTWNASVIGTAIGSYIKAQMASGLSIASASLIGLMRYSIHGIPEIAAYFIAGIAGTIVSLGIIKKEYKSGNFEKILIDATNLVVIAIGILFLAGIIEVFITPILI